MGDDVRGPILGVSLIACAALFHPQPAAGEGPAGVIVPAAETPRSARWMSRAQDNRQIPKRPKKIDPAIGAPGGVPSNVNVRPTGNTEITKEVDPDIQPETGEGEFLLPTWDRGFWVMPPGGLTRFLLPSPGLINIDEVPVRALSPREG
jgi:hypothetical protein